MRSITVTATTMGQSTPATAAEGGGYRWRKIPGWVPNDPRLRGNTEPRRPSPQSLRGSPEVRREERAKRYARFCQLRDEGMDVIPAGAEVGIERRAAARYEKQRREEREAS